MIGNTYGRLTVLSVYRDTTKNKKYRVVCDCECGTKSITKLVAHVLSGHTKSCGCIVRENAHYRNTVQHTDIEYVKKIRTMSSESRKKNKVNSRNSKYDWHYMDNGNKIQLASGYERMWVEWLQRNGYDFVYEPRAFELMGGGCYYVYTPDFYIPSLDVYVEIKGRLIESDVDKMRIFSENYTLLYVDLFLLQLYYGTTYKRWKYAYQKRYDML